MLNKFTKSKKTLSLIMSIIMSLSIIFSLDVVSTQTAEAAVNKTAVKGIYYSGNYYDSVGGLTKLLNGSYSKNDVEEGLRALIGYSKNGSFSSSASDKYIKAFGKTICGTDKKHPKYGGTAAGSLAYLWQTSERQENDPKAKGSFRLFYSKTYGTSLSNYGSATVNREHVWPQSLSGGLFGTTGAGADLHHVRPANGRLNGIRSNKAYADLSRSQITSTYYTTGNDVSSFNSAGKYLSEEELKSNYKGTLTGYASSSYFEPTDDYKGDIARIFAYLIVHYPSLENLLNNVLIGGTKTLVSWNDLDPVDSYEIQRNNTAFNYQGNRNPFIDAPGLIDEIWGNGADVSGGEDEESSDVPDIPSKSNTYKLVTNPDEIVSGSEIIIAASYGKSIYALCDDSSTSGSLKGKNVSLNNGCIISDDNSIKWEVKRTSSGISIVSKENSNNYVSCPSTGSTKLTLSKTPSLFKAGTYGAKKGLYLTSAKSRGILYNSSTKAFKNYSLNNIGASSYASEMNIYIKNS